MLRQVDCNELDLYKQKSLACTLQYKCEHLDFIYKLFHRQILFSFYRFYYTAKQGMLPWAGETEGKGKGGGGMREGGREGKGAKRRSAARDCEHCRATGQKSSGRRQPLARQPAYDSERGDPRSAGRRKLTRRLRLADAYRFLG